jgi:GNAT superfamily N-acetyltransferase
MEAVLRHARVSDALAIAPLMAQLGYPLASAEVERRLARIAGSRAVFVAEHDGAVVGLVSVSADETLIGGLEACIEGLVVDETIRSRGFGPSLLGAAERWARERGCADLIVRSNVIRTRAHGFYDRHGFATIKDQRFFRKRLR